MNEVAELETLYDQDRDVRFVATQEILQTLTDDQVRAIILSAQAELRKRFEMRQQDARQRQIAEVRRLTLERKQLASLGVTSADTNGHKKGKGKAK